MDRCARGAGDEQAAALTDLRTYLLRAALFTLQCSLQYVGHLESSILGELAEDCAQETLTAILQRLHAFRGEGRIVVGQPGGPGALPFDYFTGRAATPAWIPVPEAARAAFPSVAAIVAGGAVRRPRIKE